MLQILTTLLLCLALAIPASAQTRLPPAQGQQIVPSGATTAQSLPNLLSATNYSIPRGHMRYWGPFSGNPNYDSTPNIFWNGTQSLTSTLALEIPDDVTAIEPIYFNNSSTSVTLVDFAAWGSSQLAAPGYTGQTPGITPYDGSGNALTYMTLGSFGNGGVDSSPNAGFWTSAPPNSTNATTSGTTSTASTTLNFSSLTCPANGSKIDIPTNGSSTQNPALFSNTTVISCVANTSITMSSVPRNTINSGVTVYFSPPGITLKAPSTPPLPTLAFADWMPVTTYPRIDGPVMSGMTILRGGSPLTGTVSSTTATTAQMSSSLSADIPPGTALQACRAATLSASFTPVNQLSFANTLTTVQAGMYVWQNLNNLGPSSAQYALNTVQSVATATNTVVTLTNSTDGNLNSNSYYWNSGTSFNFGTYATVTAVSGSTITVSTSDAAKLVVGESIFQGSSGIGVNGASYAATIQTINTGTGLVTMTSAVPSTITTGMQLLFYFSAPTNAATSNALPSYVSAPQNVYQGMTVVGTNIPANTYVFYWGGTVMAWTHQPTATLTSGQTIYFCNNVTTSADSPQGQSNINFAQTTYKHRLLLVRSNWGSSNTNFWGGAASSALAVWHNYPGVPQDIYGGQCSAGNDGVLSISSISNTGGGCSESVPWPPLWGIKMFSPRRGVTIAVVGDSAPRGDTTIMGVSGFSLQSAFALNNPSTLPVSVMNLAWGGQISPVYGQSALTMIQSVQPEIVLIEGSSYNDGTAVGSSTNTPAVAFWLANLVEKYGGLPIVFSDRPQQRYGQTSLNPALITLAQANEAMLNAAASGGLVTLDIPAIVGDPAQGASATSWLNPSYTDEGIHLNFAGHAAVATKLTPLLCGLLRC